MIRGAEASLGRALEVGGPRLVPADAARPRTRPSDERDPAAEARTLLMLRLAADRLRDLRDDGVTFGYIARMYDVPTETIERVYGELIPSPPR